VAENPGVPAPLRSHFERARARAQTRSSPDTGRLRLCWAVIIGVFAGSIKPAMAGRRVQNGKKYFASTSQSPCGPIDKRHRW